MEEEVKTLEKIEAPEEEKTPEKVKTPEGTAILNEVNEYRYFDLECKEATIARLGRFTIVFIHDETINPRQQILKFGENLKFESKKVHEPQLEINTVQEFEDVSMIIAFDEDWFKHTMSLGFNFASKVEVKTEVKKIEKGVKKGTEKKFLPIEIFSGLRPPKSAGEQNPETAIVAAVQDHKDMNPIVP